MILPSKDGAKGEECPSDDGPERIGLRFDREEFTAQFGKRLRFVRNHRRLTQFELAHRTGFVKQTISNLERGLVLPALQAVFVLAEALEIHPKALLFGPEE